MSRGDGGRRSWNNGAVDALWGLTGVAIGSAVTILLQLVNLRHQDGVRREENERLAAERREGRLREASVRVLTAWNAEEVRRLHTFVAARLSEHDQDRMHDVVDVLGPLRLELTRAQIEPFSDDVLRALRRFDSSLDDVLGDADSAVGFPTQWSTVQDRVTELTVALRSMLIPASTPDPGSSASGRP